ncbi:hypothetical protein BC937DRAFT_88139 [Endogone sp. FLAS-F59071]|nr:hypothetical protein BC937DRAFT_88139 [Endogone sp. FLAS-F59071]|eukprot:RUS18949.1 hypothetical protein BC937DRAFT_88139 [Endogone sp. FLAS-F59071]
MASLNADVAAATCQKIVSVVSRAAGYDAVNRSALEALSDILGLYLENLFTLTHAYAELSNRTKPNPHDITCSLEELGMRPGAFERYLAGLMTQGAFGTDVLRNAPLGTSTVEPVPDFLPSDDEADIDDEGDGRRVREKGEVPSYMPAHLPKFPSKHSFKQTPVYVNRPDDAHKIRELNAQQSRLVEGNLKRLMNAENSIAVQAALRGSRGGAAETGAETPDVLGDLVQIVNYEAAMQRRRFAMARQGQGVAIPKRGGGEEEGWGIENRAVGEEEL